MQFLVLPWRKLCGTLKDNSMHVESDAKQVSIVCYFSMKDADNCVDSFNLEESSILFLTLIALAQEFLVIITKTYHCHHSLLFLE
jgi:hypothetical protein